MSREKRALHARVEAVEKVLKRHFLALSEQRRFFADDKKKGLESSSALD